jgi:hypothetical protein
LRRSEMELWEIMVPTVRDNGRPYRTRHHRAWDQQINRITGGMTILRPAIGKWVSPEGKLFHDRMIPVRIACTSDQMDEIMRRTLVHYPSEEAIFAYKISDEVRIVHRNS